LMIFTANVNLLSQKVKDFNVNYMLRGQVYAGSSIKDSSALGGFASSNYLPKKTTEQEIFNEEEFYIKIDASKNNVYLKKYNGYKLYIVNKSDSVVILNASDSRLYVVAEAFVKEKWQPIEYLPSSWCGNSYHQVFISPNEYWDFDIPKFSGKIKTKIRYRLKLKNGKYIYSNEVVASINKEQLTDKEGYAPKGIMDPYDE